MIPGNCVNNLQGFRDLAAGNFITAEWKPESGTDSGFSFFDRSKRPSPVLHGLGPNGDISGNNTPHQHHLP